MEHNNGRKRKTKEKEMTFSGPLETNNETNRANKHNMVKNPEDQLAIYQRR